MPWVERNTIWNERRRSSFTYLARFDSLPAHCPAENGRKNIKNIPGKYSIFDVLFVIVIYIYTKTILLVV